MNRDEIRVGLLKKDVIDTTNGSYKDQRLSIIQSSLQA